VLVILGVAVKPPRSAVDARRFIMNLLPSWYWAAYGALQIAPYLG
jgi:hypothetical protein